MPEYNENLRAIIDGFDGAHATWVSNNDLVPEARKRGVRGVVDEAETRLAADDRGFDEAIDTERARLTGQLEAAQEQHAPKHGPESVASMLSAQAAVSSGDARVIMDAHEAALRAGNEAALSILETAGPAAMPEGLRKEFRDKIVTAKEERKHPVIKEREAALADFEARAESASYARAMLRSNLVQRIRSRKGPGA